MEQNVIKKFGYITDQESIKSDSYPYFLLTIDGENKMKPLMVFPLELSAKNDGVYAIVNCGCGEWGCGGAYVKVKNTPTSVIWENFYPLSYNPETKNKAYYTEGNILTPVEFDRESYQGAIQNLLKDKDKFESEKNVYDEEKRSFEKDPISLYER